MVYSFKGEERFSPSGGLPPVAFAVRIPLLVIACLCARLRPYLLVTNLGLALLNPTTRVLPAKPILSTGLVFLLDCACLSTEHSSC